MNLRTKLIGGFFAAALIALLVSLVGYWQTQKLASALYEVGVVRLPSVQALDMVFEAKTSLDASKRELIHEATRIEAGGKEDADWNRTLAEELKRQQHSWQRAEKGLFAYKALPKTPAETEQWTAFVPEWEAWRESYRKVMDLFQQTRNSWNPSLLEEARRENEDHLYDPARRSRELLTELLRINERAAESTRQQSVASRRDIRVLGYVMLFAAAASVAGALGCGVLVSRLIRRPMGRMADAFSRISQGDLKTPVPVDSPDEIGQMAEAMNRTLETLRNNEARFRAIFENSFDGIGVSKGDRLVFANPALLALFGYNDEAEMIGRPVFDFIAPDGRAVLDERSRRGALGEKLPATFELTGLRGNGDKFIVEIHTASFLLNGEAHVVAIHRDITERRRAAIELAESAKRLELALHTSKLGIWRRHLTTQEGQWDERMFAIFGLPPNSPVPTREEMMALVMPEDSEVVWQSWNQPPTTGRTYQQRFRIKRPDGTIRYLEVHGMLHEEAGPGSEWAMGVTGDVTEIVDAAAESARLRERLSEARKMEALGTLSAGIAHDFNNLLTSTTAFIELSSTTLPAGHEAIAFLKGARQGVHSARDLVRRILTFSRRTQEFHRAPLGVGEVVRDTAPLIAAALPTHVGLDLAIDSGLPAVNADGGQIQQVLMNLCTNGAHAIGTGKGNLQIGVSLRDFTGVPDERRPDGCAAAQHVCLSVSDTGSGMDAVTLRRIFERFFTTKKAGEGTGLGLAIVKDIMTAHDGGIEVTSEPGRGTIFRLYFPATAEEKVASTPPESGLTVRGYGQRILVVDDEPTITAVVQIILTKAGYNPEVFCSSQEAMIRFQQAPGEFHLLMIDQQMPGLTGGDFIAGARRLAPGLPVVKMSGRFESLQTDDEPNQPKTRQIKKPFELSELLDHVAEALRS